MAVRGASGGGVSRSGAKISSGPQSQFRSLSQRGCFDFELSQPSVRPGLERSDSRAPELVVTFDSSGSPLPSSANIRGYSVPFAWIHLSDQCDINVGLVIEASIPRVVPPRINSRSRECPYPPMTMRSAYISAANDRIVFETSILLTGTRSIVTFTP